jgi:hypothetical protein
MTLIVELNKKLMIRGEVWSFQVVKKKISRVRDRQIDKSR